MSLTPKSRIQAISAKLPSMDVEVIKGEMRACVQGFCQNDANKWFSVRDLFGKEYSDWTNTSMQRIYDYYKRRGYTDKEAYKRAAIDVGRLLKRVLDEDKNCIYTFTKKRTNMYKKIP